MTTTRAQGIEKENTKTWPTKIPKMYQPSRAAKPQMYARRATGWKRWPSGRTARAPPPCDLLPPPAVCAAAAETRARAAAATTAATTPVFAAAAAPAAP